eukprot:894245-Rhodomonas_salina.5
MVGQEVGEYPVDSELFQHGGCTSLVAAYPSLVPPFRRSIARLSTVRGFALPVPHITQRTRGSTQDDTLHECRMFRRECTVANRRSVSMSHTECATSMSIADMAEGMHRRIAHISTGYRIGGA